ncbi:hypothetical protein [Beduini massiliensis]|uniref:hypothetical protein n=1 Tax=Beduini massiliensis TaxID=1585974 RepID=UPI00059A9B16|nr:hypothetical protein [Beduini massiliensis]
MNNDLTEIIKKIITIDELKKFTDVEEKLSKYDEAYIFQNNEPTHVIMSLKRYERFITDTKKQSAADVLSVNLDALLNKIGKKVFVDYYDVFKNDSDSEKALEKEGFTLASRRSRSSSARAIFKNHLQIEALNNIIASVRMDMEIVNKAKDILSKELQSVSTICHEDLGGKYNNQQRVKIGKMMRGILTKLLQNNTFTEDELSQLLNANYSKEIFNLNFSVLKTVSSKETLDQAKRDTKGYNRYYDTAILVKGKKYLICSQWIENLHRVQAEQWLVDKMVELLGNTVLNIPVGHEFSIHEILSDYWIYMDQSVRKRVSLEFENVNKKLNIEVTTENDHEKVYRKVS